MTTSERSFVERFTAAEPGAPAEGAGSMLARALRFAVDYRTLVVGCALGSALVAGLATIARGTTYTAESRFIPQATGGGSLSRLAGLAAQFGVDVPAGGSGGASADLYVRLVQSREILEDVALARYAESGSASPARTLLEVYDLRHRDSVQRTLMGVDLLRRQLVRASADPRSGIVTIEVRAGNRGLSEQINRRVLERIAGFNLQRRQSQAAAERGFLERRLNEAQGELRSAEERMAAFLQQNRAYGAPHLANEHARHQRAIDLRQQIYTNLAQAYEQARIEEVRNTPVITIIDHPEGSARRRRGLVTKTLIGFLVGALLGLGLAALTEYVRREEARDPEAFNSVRFLTRRLFTLRGRRRIVPSLRG